MSETDTTTEERTFSVHTNIIWDFLFRQHHSLDSAVGELIQNAFDAGARNIRVDLNNNGFTCSDDGKGFQSKAEILDWFEVFGAPRDDKSDSKFGRFRMGRGQIMGLASTSWRSGAFKMQVDPKKKGLDYTLEQGLDNHKGCAISGVWYDKAEHEDPDQLEYLIRRITNRVRYMFDLNLYINGELISSNPSELKWTLETDDFYFLREDPYYSSYKKKIEIYNLGIFIDRLTGFYENGIVITKKHLKLNMTRSKIQPDCPVLESIKTALKANRRKISTVKKYSCAEAESILRAFSEGQLEFDDIYQARLISDLHNRKTISLRELTSTLHTIPFGASSQEMDIVDQFDKYFVVNLDCIPFEFSHKHNYHVEILFEAILKVDRDFYGHLQRRHVSFDAILDSIDTNQITLFDSQLTKKERQIIKALNKIRIAGYWPGKRKIVLGISAKKRQRGELYGNAGWTDGHSFIAIDRNWLASLGTGLPMAMRLMQLLIHEICHKAGNTETHNGEFYKDFHDNMQQHHSSMTEEFLRKYDDILGNDKSKTTAKMERAIQAVRRNGKAKCTTQ